LWELEEVTELAQAPLLRLEHVLQPWVAFVIVPLFALANAGVAIGSGVLRIPPDPIALGVILGLIVGKQVGITAASLLIVRLGLASLPDGSPGATCTRPAGWEASGSRCRCSSRNWACPTPATSPPRRSASSPHLQSRAS
jgi:NhaA family Na+:H+ antiporter